MSLDHRLDLRVMGDVPEDLQRFINVAHAGYAAAAEKPFTDKLSERGYPPETQKNLSGALDRLATLDGVLDSAEDTAENGPTNTEDRDAAYIDLKEYMKEIRGVARGLFRKQPKILQELSL